MAAIDTVQERHTDTTQLREVRQTVESIYQKLIPYLWTKVAALSFDVCVADLGHALHATAAILEKSPFSTGVGPADALPPSPSNPVSEQAFWIPVFRWDSILKRKLDQINVLFPGESGYEAQVGDVISDSQGRAFWLTTFSKRAIVPWNTFWTAFQRYCRAATDDYEQRLKYFLDFTRNGYVTAYEFNAFLHWFGPLATAVAHAKEVMDSGILGGFVSAVELQFILRNEDPGTFVIRFSKSKPGSFALTWVDRNRSVRHTLLCATSDPYRVCLCSPRETYDSLLHFVDANKQKLRKPYPLAPWEDKEETPSEPEQQSPSPSPLRASRSGAEQCVVCLTTPRDTVFMAAAICAAARTVLLAY
eukprot:CAMPEP_0119136070 /NCGR_PEP_ID=MMETSP1310-20130426/20676_1 /TAXON_ID=464262 /ORGANISM="Genus nov. species nov., Strain RCC2339" /LENGTH=360 /DNA_ID=CAMNT_0007127035 /DNA_START=44 /DNA_END=1124 /DNA_ORIENTATION=-